MKKAIIIGATSGIGRAFAATLVNNGFTVGITGRRENLLAEVANELPGKIIPEVFDIAKTETNISHLELLVSKLGGLDLIFINSGVGFSNPELDFKLEKDTIDINVTGTVQIADWSFNYFRKQNSGQILINTSVAGLRGGRFAPAYSASKAFLINYCESLRQMSHHLKLNVKITDIRPGFVDTKMAQAEYKFWVSTVEKASRQIYKAALKKKRVAYITKRWVIPAYLMKLIPKWLYEKG